MIRKGQRVERLLNDPDLNEAFEVVELSLWEEFKGLRTQDTEAMSQIRLALFLLEKIKTSLEQAITDGKVEKSLLEEKEKERKGIWKTLRT